MRAIPQRQPLFLGGSIGGVPSFDLNFARGDNAVTKYGFVFTRATSATYVNSTGLIATAASGELRYTYDPVTLASLGVLIEEARTNVILSSQDIASASWTRTDITFGSDGVSPTGLTEADLVIEGSAGTASARQSAVVGAGVTFTASAYLKRGNCDWILFDVQSGSSSNGFRCWVNVNTKTRGTFSAVGTGTATSASVSDAGNGWVRVVATGIVAPADASGKPRIQSASADGSATNVSGAQYYLWGVQVEVGAFPTSYIPTTGTAATRNADVLSLTGAAGRTNLAYPSTGCAVNVGCAVATSAYTTPSGEAAKEITWDGASSGHNAYLASSSNIVTYTSGQVYSLSVFVKAGTGDRVQLTMPGSPFGAAQYANFYLSGAGSVSASAGCTASIAQQSDGWYRLTIANVSCTGTFTTYPALVVGIVTGSESRTPTTTANTTIHVGSTQVENASTATTYIPTTSGPRTVENVASWFNGDAGTWVAEITRQTAPTGQTGGAAPRAMTIIDSSTANSYYISVAASGSGRSLGASPAGTQWDITPTANYAEDGTVYRVAVAYATNDVQVCDAGTLGTNDTSVVLPYALQIIYLSGVGTRYLNGTISRLRYYPRRLPNATLKSLTA